MADKTITCKDCGNEFIFTEKEQEFYKLKGFSDPLRCKSCRDERKRRHNQNRRNSNLFN